MNELCTKAPSYKQEHMIADYLGWSVVSGSGARRFHPGDIVSADYLGECKTHMKKQPKIVFYREHWDKIKDEAMSQFKTPVLFVDNGTQNIENTYCVLPYSKISPFVKTYEYSGGIICGTNINLSNIEDTGQLVFPGVKQNKISTPLQENFYFKCKWKFEFVAILSLNFFKKMIDGELD